MITRHTYRSAFTIVELILVITVIAILSALVVVAYNGVRQQALDASLETDIANATKQLTTYRLSQEAGQSSYPASLDALTELTASNGNTFTYYYFAVDNSYCVEVTNGSATKSATSAQTDPVDAGCGVTDGIIAWWPLNGNANDASGNGHNGTSSGVTFDTGQNGAANGSFYFNNTGAVSTTGAISFTPTSFTASAWIKASSSGDRKILDFASGASHIMQILPGGVYRICMQNGGSVSCAAASGPNLADGNWHLLTTIGDGTSVRGYVDDNSTPVVTLATPSSNVNGAAYIGRDPSDNYRFWGWIDDVRVFDRPISMSELSMLYTMGAE